MKSSFLINIFLSLFLLSACGGATDLTSGQDTGTGDGTGTGAGTGDVAGDGAGDGTGDGAGDGAVVNVSVIEVELGKLIFEDTRLSANNNQSCASCHDAKAGFADPLSSKASPVSEGSIEVKFGGRNAPTSAYAQYTPAFAQINDPERGLIYAGGQFLDGRRDTLEEQAMDPFLNPVEMANLDKKAVVDKVISGAYANKFMEVYGADVFNNTDDAYNKIAQAIAVFERSAEMNKFNSKYDCYKQDPIRYPLALEELFGLLVFTGKGKCSSCHTLAPDPQAGKALFTNFQYFNIGVPSNPDNPENQADVNFVDLGLGGELSDITQNGKFRTPTLRNIELTAPYMHNGVFDTLEEVVRFYNIEEKAVAFPAPEVSENIANDAEFLGLEDPKDIDVLVTFMKIFTDGTGVGICF